MRWKMPAGVLVALAFLIPAAPAAAQTEPPVLDAACQTVERKVFKDIRELIKIDLDTASDTDVRVLAGQILTVARANSLPLLPRALQTHLDGTPEELRAFLKNDVLKAWTTALRVSVVRTLTNAGPNVQAAAQKTLDAGKLDGYLTYLNEGLYAARALDCAAQPTATPSVTPTVTPSATTSAEPGVPATVTPGPSSTEAPGNAGGEGGGLPVTGANAGTLAAISGALVLLGGVGYLIGRRRRSRFVA
jgi:LPXTG-motif cell wall-anchored protein